MRWEKLGQIFDPTRHALAEGCTVFAKSPQAIVFDDFVRIYYSSQKKTDNGKYVSCPQYVDFTKQFDRILGLSRAPLIALGELGEFDEHGIFPFSVLRHEQRILAYTSGWSRRSAVSIDMAIGLARSDSEGVAFVKHGAGGPVMAAAHNEPCLVGDAFVRHIEGQFHMWYIFGQPWQRPRPDAQPERFYKIAHATSQDGVDWRRDGKEIIPAVLEHECQALPTVFFRNGKYHMYFCYRNAYDFRSNSEHAYRLGYASSADMQVWQRDDEQAGIDLTAGAWDGDMMCYPHAFECDGQMYMLYNGNQFGKFGFGIARLVE